MLYKKDNAIGDEKMLCELHTAIFSLFDIYCRKSQEEKLKRMNKEGRVEEMMNVLSGEYAAFVENVLKMNRENMKKFPDVEVKIRMIKAMMTFSFFFLTQSNELKEKLKENTESSFISFVNLICDNKQKESIRELITVGASIKQEIIDFRNSQFDNADLNYAKIFENYDTLKIERFDPTNPEHQNITDEDCNIYILLDNIS